MDLYGFKLTYAIIEFLKKSSKTVSISEITSNIFPIPENARSIPVNSRSYKQVTRRVRDQIKSLEAQGMVVITHAPDKYPNELKITIK